MAGAVKWSESRRPTQHRRRSAGPGALGTHVRYAAIAALGVLLVACGVESKAEIPQEPVLKLLLIGIDGVRADVLAEVPTPHLDGLVAEGTLAAATRTTTPSVSGPAWSSMLTGVWPAKHGVTDNEFGGRRYEDFPGFLTLIERERPEMSTFAVADWVPLMELEGGSTVLGPEIDRRVRLDGYELGWAEADARGTALAVDELRDGDPDASFVYLGNPDEVSHTTGSIGREYRDAIVLADRHVGQLLEAVRARPTYATEQWLFIVSTDHGRRADGGHGGDSDEEMTTFIIVSGPGAASGTARRETFIVDVAATALAYLGMADTSGTLDGRPLGLRSR